MKRRYVGAAMHEIWRNRNRSAPVSVTRNVEFCDQGFSVSHATGLLAQQ
jgi:hypothetical protein